MLLRDTDTLAEPVRQLLSTCGSFDSQGTGHISLQTLRNVLLAILDSDKASQVIEKGARVDYNGFIQWLFKVELVAEARDVNAELDCAKARAEKLSAELEETRDKLNMALSKADALLAEIEDPRCIERGTSAQLLDTAVPGVTGVHAFPRDSEYGQQQRTSLARLAALWKAKIVMVSSPEMGRNTPSEIDINGKEVFDERVMSVLEHLPEHLADDIEVHVPVAYSASFGSMSWRRETYKPEFTLAVDFAGSASKRLCDSTVRWVSVTGQEITGAGDFDRNYTVESLNNELHDEPPEKPQPGAEFQRTVSNSFWSLFWRGQVSGALVMALTAAEDMPTLANEWERSCYCQHHSKEAELYLDSGKGATARVVIAASIDGGVITDFERTELPAVVRGVLSSVRLRGYSWGDNIHILWCRFPTLRAFLDSAAGVPNLLRTEADEAVFATDDEQQSTSFFAEEEISAIDRAIDGPWFHENLLKCDVESVLAADLAVNDSSLVRAAKNGDYETTRGLLDRKANINAVNDHQETALEVAASHGHSHIVELLLEVHESQDLQIQKTALAKLKDIPRHFFGRKMGTSKAGGDAMGKFLAKCPALESICFRDLDMTVAAFEQMVQAAPPELPWMKSIDFSYNKMLLVAEDGGSAMGKLLAKCPAVEIVDLGFTGMTTAALAQLVQMAPPELPRLSGFICSGVDDLFAAEQGRSVEAKLFAKFPGLQVCNSDISCADTKNVLRQVKIFEALPDVTIDKLVELVKVRFFAPGETIFSQGDKSTSMFIIKHGEFKALVDEREIARLGGTGRFLGECSLLQGKCRVATCVAVGSMCCWELFRRDLERCGGLCLLPECSKGGYSKQTDPGPAAAANE